MKESFYFSHDYSAKENPNIIKLRMKHGWKGYGVFWAIIEILAQEKTSILECNYDIIAYQLREEKEVVKSVIDDFNLFEFGDYDKINIEKSGSFFYSKRLLEHKKKRKEISDKRSEAGRKGGLSKVEANAKQMLSKTEVKTSKGKERKGKEIKGKENNKEKCLFEEFWKKYPDKNNQSKKKTKDRYLKLIKEKGLHEKIMEKLSEHIEIYEINKEAGTWQPNWKHAITWLNQECWENEASVDIENSMPKKVKEKIQKYRANLNKDPSDKLVKQWKEELFNQ